MRLRFLIVEDDLLNCKVYKLILKDEMLDLDFAYDGEQGINLFTGNNYDLVLLDMNLPLLTGLEVAKYIRDLELKESKPKVPIIAVSADTSAGMKQKAYDCGVNEYLNKPVGRYDLIKRVKLYINDPRLFPVKTNHQFRSEN
ncbi:response regulator [Mucilaginibacter sp. RS28]|uniref:Response regulator n=1 Tax=Mucilaginibacter straminoryzae TaxID=2932774 RepID=A0A9X1X2B5_9SPHI|nr:response regulator [Mucilaginibacter straminoryzae]MCJ8209708.1 response regulator [Mucilaginibacter straminoryzae]